VINDCAHNVESRRLLLRNGRMRNDVFCILCGVNKTLLAEGTRRTWEDLDEPSKAFKQWFTEPTARERRTRAVQQAEEREIMSNVTPRTFKCTQGASSKFWTVWREGSTHTVVYGRIGTTGQVCKTPHPSTNLANLAISKLIRSKVSKGYYEVVDRSEDARVERDRSSSTMRLAQRERERIALNARAKREREGKQEREARQAKAKILAESATPPGFMKPRKIRKVEKQ